MFGSGFKKVYSLCNAERIKVKYDLDPYGFSFFFLRNTGSISSGSMLNKRDDWMSDIERSVLSLIKEKPTISSKEISEKLKRTPRTIQRSLVTLKEGGKIKRIGTQRRGYWEIVM